MNFDKSLIKNIELFFGEHDKMTAKEYLSLKTKIRVIGIDPFDLYRKSIRKLLK